MTTTKTIFLLKNENVNWGLKNINGDILNYA